MKNLGKEIKVTNHFVERYYERVFNCTPPELSNRKESFKMKKIRKVLNDISARISDRDIKNLLLLKNCKNVKVPFLNNQIIIRSGRLITVY